MACAAAANASATAASSPNAQSYPTLSGASGWIAGPPTAVATCTGRSSKSQTMSSTASIAAARVSATTSAIGSPA